MGAKNRTGVAIMARDVFIPNSSTVTAVKETGTTVPKTAVACYDVAVNPATAGAHGLGVYIPANAIILDTIIDVVTTFTDGTDDSATIAASIQSAGDLVAAIAISDASNVWDAGIRGTKITAPNLGADAAHDSQLEVVALIAATKVKTTAVREITLTNAVHTLTAGKANIFVTYIVSD